MSGHPLALTAPQFLARSREIAGIDLVDEDAIEPLTVLVNALNAEAALDAEGARAYEAKFLRLLVNRLRMKRDFRAHPEIAEQAGRKVGIAGVRLKVDPALADKRAGAGTRAYVCRGTTCSPPIESLTDLARHAAARVS